MPYSPSVKETREIVNAFAACLRQLYAAAGVEVPPKFNPNREAKRLIKALKK